MPRRRLRRRSVPRQLHGGYRPATEAQLDFLIDLGGKPHDGINRAQASALIDARLRRRRERPV